MWWQNICCQPHQLISCANVLLNRVNKPTALDSEIWPRILNFDCKMYNHKALGENFSPAHPHWCHSSQHLQPKTGLYMSLGLFLTHVLTCLIAAAVPAASLPQDYNDHTWVTWPNLTNHSYSRKLEVQVHSTNSYVLKHRTLIMSWSLVKTRIITSPWTLLFLFSFICPCSQPWRHLAKPLISDPTTRTKQLGNVKKHFSLFLIRSKSSSSLPSESTFIKKISRHQLFLLPDPAKLVLPPWLANNAPTLSYPHQISPPKKWLMPFTPARSRHAPPPDSCPNPLTASPPSY